MKILVVFAHPRRDSLSGKVCDAFIEGAESSDHEVEFADLYAENFDPLVQPPDEPDWEDAGKTFSNEVEKEMDRIRRNEATVMVFPIWWWSMPAMLKGWVDRVWNHGFAYAFAEGSKTYPHRHALMIGVAGTDRESYRKRNYDGTVYTQLDTGILDYCEIENHGLALFYDTLGGNASLMEEHLGAARKLGRVFPDFNNLPD